jgi:hypothetical protein
MAIPQPEPRDWQLANARELQVTDREVLAMLRASKRRVEAILKTLPTSGAQIRRAQLEESRARLLAEQANVFERLGDIVQARRARAASRSMRLSAAADAQLLALVGKGAQGQFLYESALQVSQRAIDVALARMRLSELPLSQRIYRTSVWMGGRLGKLINETLASGLDAKEFAKRALDWFNPNTPGGVRYAAMRLARTEINNSFHAISAQKYAETPWITQVEWNLSKSHPKPDICNAVAADSPYASDKTPARPHPQCMCYITPKSIDENEFVDRFLDGEYDEYLDAELERNGWAEPEAPELAPVQLPKPEPVRAPQEQKVGLKSIYGNMLHIDPEAGDIGALHLHDLAKVPQSLHEKVVKLLKLLTPGTGGIFIGDKAVPELSPESAKLRGVRPRGWGEGQTWDQVPGAYMPRFGQLLLGGGNHGHGSTSLAQHEFGHALDATLLYSEKKRFATLFLELHGIVKVNPYFSVEGNPSGFVQEAFAEAFAAWSKYRTEPATASGLHGALVPIKGALGVRHPTDESVKEANVIVQRIIDYFEELATNANR